MTRKRRQHLANRNNIIKGIMKLLLRDVAKIKGYVQLCSKLPGRTIRNGKELQELAV